MSKTKVLRIKDKKQTVPVFTGGHNRKGGINKAPITPKPNYIPPAIKSNKKSGNKTNISPGDWILCPRTAEDIDAPNIVTKVDRVEGNIVYIRVKDGAIPMPIKYCRVVYIQKCNFREKEEE